MARKKHNFLKVSLYSFVCGIVLFFLTGSYAQAQFMGTIEGMIYDLTNQERQAQGVPPVTRLIRLENMARQHSEEMALLDYFDHVSEVPEYKTQVERAQMAGVTGYSLLGENIDWQLDPFNPTDAQIAQRIIDDWMVSQHHRENMLDSRFTHLGVGVYKEGDTIYATQNFGAFFSSPPNDNVAQYQGNNTTNGGSQPAQQNTPSTGGLNYFGIPIPLPGAPFSNSLQGYGNTLFGSSIGTGMTRFGSSFGNTSFSFGSLPSSGIAYSGGFSPVTMNWGNSLPAFGGTSSFGSFSGGGFSPTTMNWGNSLPAFGGTSSFGTLAGGGFPSMTKGFGSSLPTFGGTSSFGSFSGGGFSPTTMNWGNSLPAFGGTSSFGTLAGGGFPSMSSNFGSSLSNFTGFASFGSLFNSGFSPFSF